ncbi:hypothetical protein O6P43_026780 [Quillaja saponaria]|uniref:Uncharacterized protein n=1 Tax=Quillaja saponaria TaxID=32244 RepID=A0AAD7PD18_QUISA|nr:hypothetical protein O6P43_026780 [Quillaja saponaria]
MSKIYQASNIRRNNKSLLMSSYQDTRVSTKRLVTYQFLCGKHLDARVCHLEARDLPISLQQGILSGSHT